MKIESSSETETLQIAEALSSALSPGEVLGLIGDLGAGKTAFVRGLAKGLGATERVSSPTYVLEHVYECSTQNGIEKLVHWDLYRLESKSAPGEIFEFGKDSSALTIVEWPERVSELDPLINSLLEIHIPQAGSELREFTFTRASQELVEKLAQLGWKN